MKKTAEAIVNKAVLLRREGLSHRQISVLLQLSLGTIYNYSRTTRLTKEQHLYLKRHNLQQSLSKLTPEQRLEAARRGGLNTPSHFKKQYTEQTLRASIKEFYSQYQRIPLKREFVHEKIARKHFGSWNNAVVAAGLRPNPVKFSQKYIARDGHKCDSLAEKIIDDWLSSRKIVHEKGVRYPRTKFTADFKVRNTYVEFFGLHGQLPRYDLLMKQKLKMIQKEGVKLISIYPEDLFPKSQLHKVLHEIC